MRRACLFSTSCPAVVAAAAVVTWALAVAAPAAVHDVAIWDLNAVDADGRGTHPLVGTEEQVRFTGVVLNAPADMLNPGAPGPMGADAWQVYVQALPEAGQPQPGGIAVFAASPYYAGTPYSWPRYPTDFAPGDVVEVVGYVGDYNGKVNLNERHDPWYGFQVTHVEDGGVPVNVGLPAPFELPDVAACIAFDPTRAAGGERYQGQWCTLRGVHIAGGTWGDGQTVALADGSTLPGGGQATIDCVLGYSGFFGTGAAGDFSQYAAPTGLFNVTALFDQEDVDGDGDGVYDAGYRVWPLQRSQLQLWGDANLDMYVDLVDVGTVYDRYTGADTPPARAWADGDFDGDADVDLVDVGALLANWTGAPTAVQALAAADPGAACGTYDAVTGEVVLSAAGIEYLRIDGPGLLTGDAPAWDAVLTGGYYADGCDDWTGFWALNNAQTFTDAAVGAIAVPGLTEGDLVLVYQAGLATGQVTVPLAVVPEPATAVLAALGAAALVRRRTARPHARGA